MSGTLNVTATATDAVGLARVEFSVDGTSIGVDTTGGNGWSVQWDTTTHPGGAASVSATAIDTAGRTASDAASVTVDNSAPGTVVMVVANPSSLIAGEVAVRNRLTNDGFSVAVIDDNLVTPADANGTAFVFVSSTTDANTLRARLRDVLQPVWMAKPYLLDDMLMTGPAADVDYGSVASASVAITNAAHPLAAGLSGTVTVTTANPRSRSGYPGRPPTSWRPRTVGDHVRLSGRRPARRRHDGGGLPPHIIGVPERTGELHGRRMDTVRCRRRLRGVELPGCPLAAHKTPGRRGANQLSASTPTRSRPRNMLWRASRFPRGIWTIRLG